MQRSLRALAAICALLLLLCASTALAQKRGGILTMYTPDSPASMSIHEEATVFAQGPRRRFHPGLSLPCPAWADAPAPDRHRAVQIRRVQAERAHQGGAQPGLLETRAALSRRHRIHGDPQPGDGGSVLCVGTAR